MLSTTVDRVPKHTRAAVAARIRKQTELSVLYHERHPDEIPGRLKELDREWDIERALETGSSALTLFGIVFGVGVNRKWLLLSCLVQGFFLQHALQGWCPPLPALRKLGVRTAQEIESERCALLGIAGREGSSRRPAPEKASKS